MKTTRSLVLGTLLAAAGAGLSAGAPVEAPQHIDPAPLDRLLRKYVNERGLVDYAGWKAAAEDRLALQDYVARFASGPPCATGNEKAASLINALTLQWLGRGDLNRFLPANNHVVLSPIFNWFRDDFDKAGGVRAVLSKYAPVQDADFLNQRYEISFATYDWALNEQPRSE